MAQDALTANVALVHDYLLVMRGAERVFDEMAALWPGASISTLLYDEAATRGRFSGHEIHTSPLQLLHTSQHSFRRLLPLYPQATTRLHVPGADIVVSSSSAFAHGVTVSDETPHLCYCHSPFRYVWHERERAIDELPNLARVPGTWMLDRMRDWDRHASERVTTYLANSELTRARIAEFYQRDAQVLHPPVAVDRFSPSADHDDYFLIVGELVRHKNAEVALMAAERAGVPMKVVGWGPDGHVLSQRYPNAEFLGRVDDATLARLYSRAKAFVMAAVEEFGIVAAEAHAAGRPVLAAGAGGALEIVQPGITGALAPPGNVDAFAQAMRDVDWNGFDPIAVRARAEEFSAPAFREGLKRAVDGTLGTVAKPDPAPSNAQPSGSSNSLPDVPRPASAT